MQLAVFNRHFVKTFALCAFALAFLVPSFAFANLPEGANVICNSVRLSDGTYPQCCDGIDNDGDAGEGPVTCGNLYTPDGKRSAKADYYGVDCPNLPDYPSGDGILDMEPDPSCLSARLSTHPDEQSEKPDDVQSSIIPCTDKCTLVDVFLLINNILSFFFKLLIPLFVIMLMYTGWQYLKSKGSPKQYVKLLSMIRHMIFGLLIILFAWLIVKVLLSTIEYSDDLLFFAK